MGRTADLSPLGLYNWDNTIFDLMQLPEELDRDVLIKNILYSTAELEVLYPNPVVFKNLVGLWSAKNIDVWQRLYNTTQYEYNPIENYNRYEEGTTSDAGRTTHSGSDGRTEAITHGGKDTLDMTRRDGGTEALSSSYGIDQGGQDTTSGTHSSTSTRGHWIAGFNSLPSSQQDDGLVKQTRDQDSTSETTSSTTTYGKTEDGTGTSTTTFGKTETNKDETTYGKTENVSETRTYGQQVNTTNDGEHTLHAHGNIGVTTTQKLIKEQRQIDLFNVYDIIIEDFKMKFCILVY